MITISSDCRETLTRLGFGALQLGVCTGVVTMLLCYGFGLVFYCFKWPETGWPGRFDFFLHSHQVRFFPTPGVSALSLSNTPPPTKLDARRQDLCP